MITNSKIRDQQQATSNSSENGATAKIEDSGGMRYGRSGSSNGGDQRKINNVITPRAIKRTPDYEDNDDRLRYDSNESLNFTARGGQAGKIASTGVLMLEDMRIIKKIGC